MTLEMDRASRKVVVRINRLNELTEERVVVEPQLLRGNNYILTGLNWFVPEGFWLNAKTDDAGVLITIAAYRVPIERG